MLFVPWRLPPKGRIFEAAFKAAEQKHGLPNNLLARMAEQESHFKPDIIDGSIQSPAGAIGLMQIIPRWHPNVNPLDPFASIEYAGDYIKRLYKRFGSWNKALAAYNWGQGNLDKWLRGEKEHMPLETQNYVREILSDIWSLN